MIGRSAGAIGLLLLWLSTQHAVDAQVAGPQLVSVELSNFEFSPNTLTFEHGRTYRLHLTNTSSGGHDFTAPEFFAGSTIDKGDRKFVVDGKIRLSAGQSVDITLTPREPGTYKLHCSHFMHGAFGMHGTITVR